MSARVTRVEAGVLASLCIAALIAAGSAAAVLGGQILAAVWGGMCAAMVAGTTLVHADRPLWRRRLVHGVEDTWHTRRLLAVLLGGVITVPRAAYLTGLPRWEVMLLLTRLESAGWVTSVVAPNNPREGWHLTGDGWERARALLLEPAP